LGFRGGRQRDWRRSQGGVVTLTGFIDSYAGKLAAERVVKRVRGVRAVANDITVRLKVDVTDTDIAAAAALALKIRPGIPPNVQATVHNRHATLTGHVSGYIKSNRRK